MRILIVGLCVLGTACADAALTSPAAPTVSFLHAGDGIRQTSARNGSQLPFRGDLQANEKFVNPHSVTGGGTGNHLGTFTYAAEITVDDDTGDGTGTVLWTAANGDTISATTHGVILEFSESEITVRETQTISGGTGRFSGASGTIILTRTLDLATGSTSGTYTGTINQGS